MLQTTTTKDIQRNYRRVFDLAKRTRQPVIVMRNSKPDVAIVDIKTLEEMEAISTVLRSRTQARLGKTKILGSLVELWHEAKRN